MADHDLRASRRYATAFFNAAHKQNKLPVVIGDLKTLLDLMNETPALKQMWDSPVIPSGRKRELTLKMFSSDLDPLTISFLRLLIDKRREFLLPTVQMELQELTDTSNHLIRAEATFAVDPTPEEVAALTESLERRTGENVKLIYTVNADIIGGVVVRMQDTIIDGSVRGTLERLREQLLTES